MSRACLGCVVCLWVMGYRVRDEGSLPIDPTTLDINSQAQWKLSARSIDCVEREMRSTQKGAHELCGRWPSVDVAGGPLNSVQNLSHLCAR